MSLVAALPSEWQIISQAPILFGSALVTLVCAATGAVWLAMKWAYTNRIENLESRNKLLSDLNTDYKNKLDVQTPQEAEDKLRALETRLELVEQAAESEADKFHKRSMEAAAQGKALIGGGKLTDFIN